MNAKLLATLIIAMALLSCGQSVGVSSESGMKKMANGNWSVYAEIGTKPYFLILSAINPNDMGATSTGTSSKDDNDECNGSWIDKDGKVVMIYSAKLENDQVFITINDEKFQRKPGAIFVLDQSRHISSLPFTYQGTTDEIETDSHLASMLDTSSNQPQSQAPMAIP